MRKIIKKYFKKNILKAFLFLTLFASIFFVLKTNAADGDCKLPRGEIIESGDSIVGYSMDIIYTPNTTCDQFSGKLSCINGLINGSMIATKYKYKSCKDGLPQDCKQRNGGTIFAGTTITGYSVTGTVWPNKCNQFSTQLLCFNGNINGDYINYKYSQCKDGKAKNCDQRNGGIISHGDDTIGYSVTGVAFNETCEKYSTNLSCTNGIINGWYQIYQYPKCKVLDPKNCDQRNGGTIKHGTGNRVIGYSLTGTSYPETCEKFSTKLRCYDGIINGNFQTYKYSQCKEQKIIPGVDLSIVDSIGLLGGANTVAKGSKLELLITIKNNGDKVAIANNVFGGWLTCKRGDIDVYSANAGSNFVLNPGTKMNLNIRINDILTQKTANNKKISCFLNIKGINDVNTGNNIWIGKFDVLNISRFDLAMTNSISPIKSNLDSAEPILGSEGIKNFIFSKVMNVLVPLIIIIGILTAILGFYKLMFGTGDEETKAGSKYLIFGVVGIIIIVSAKYLGTNIYELILGNNTSFMAIKGFSVAQGIYDKLIFPFIKFAVYIIFGVMFVILLTRVITFVFGKDEDSKKKASTIILWNIIAMIVMIGAEKIVEVIYGSKDKVAKDMSNLGEIGTGILATKNIPLVYNIINRILGLTTFVILIIIIAQTIQLLLKPDNADQIKKMKSSLIYIFLGIIVIGAGYLIVNFLIIN